MNARPQKETQLRTPTPSVSPDSAIHIRDDPLVIPNIIHAQGGQNSVITDGRFSVVILKQEKTFKKEQEKQWQENLEKGYQEFKPEKVNQAIEAGQAIKIGKKTFIRLGIEKELLKLADVPSFEEWQKQMEHN